MAAAMRVSSAALRRVGGRGQVSESLSSSSLRAVSAASFTPSKRVASLASSTGHVDRRSLASAARISVSSVM